jgi:hypothetical protein
MALMEQKQESQKLPDLVWQQHMKKMGTTFQLCYYSQIQWIADGKKL